MPASAACSNPHVFAHTLRFSARGFLALTKNAWFLEVPLICHSSCEATSICLDRSYRHRVNVGGACTQYDKALLGLCRGKAYRIGVRSFELGPHDSGPSSSFFLIFWLPRRRGLPAIDWDSGVSGVAPTASNGCFETNTIIG